MALPFLFTQQTSPGQSACSSHSIGYSPDAHPPIEQLPIAALSTQQTSPAETSHVSPKQSTSTTPPEDDELVAVELAVELTVEFAVELAVEFAVEPALELAVDPKLPELLPVDASVLDVVGAPPAPKSNWS